MADNFPAADASAVTRTVAADEAVDATLGTVLFQMVKLVDGTLGGTDKAGVTTAYGLAVDVKRSATRASSFRGRVQTFRTPGRAGTAGQKIFALHNATASAVVVYLNQLTVDLAVTAAKAVTVLPPLIRIHRFTALPTNGTALTKVAKDTTKTSAAAVTAWGDASADATGSATTLTIPISAGNMITQEFAPRLITAAGYEMFDRTTFLENADIRLGALEGIVVFLDYVLATQNPVTDMWAVGCDWDESAE